MRCFVRVIVLGALLCCGCRDRVPQSKWADASAAAPPPPSSGDELLRHVSARAKGRVLGEIKLSYVRPDGLMDPAYGGMTAEIGELPPPPPADDPARPVGAPTPSTYVNVLGGECWRLSWSPGGAVSEEQRSFCGPAFGEQAQHQALRCSATQLWERARKDGAPAGLAVISWTLMVLRTEGDVSIGKGWKFSITDAPRNISFEKEYPDDCIPVVEREPS